MTFIAPLAALFLGTTIRLLRVRANSLDKSTADTCSVPCDSENHSHLHVASPPQIAEERASKGEVRVVNDKKL